jgi:hypothetical protein
VLAGRTSLAVDQCCMEANVVCTADMGDDCHLVFHSEARPRLRSVSWAATDDMMLQTLDCLQLLHATCLRFVGRS